MRDQEAEEYMQAKEEATYRTGLMFWALLGALVGAAVVKACTS